MIEQKVPLGDASKCVRNLLQIIQYNDAFDLAANNLALEIKNSVRFHWRQLNPGSSTPEPEFINQFYDEVINRLKTKISGEPPAQVAEKIAQVREKAARHGRQVRFGIRLHVIVRETNEEAWQAADSLISHLDDETIARAQAAFARTDSVGQQRMAALHNGRRDKLEISPNLWAGVGLARGGAGTALVGDAATVAERINEYAALGIDSFIFSGYPHLEEAYRVGELLFPLLDVAVPSIPQPQNLRLQGEAVANEFIPRKVAQS